MLIFLFTLNQNPVPMVRCSQKLLSPYIRFEVVSVSILSGREALTRAPHTLGVDTAVRLRLANESTKPLYFLTFESDFIGIMPLGFHIKQTNKGIIWLYGKERCSDNSPGIKKVSAGLTTKWLILQPKSAIEWEKLDSTLFSSEQHAFTVYVKETENSKPIELKSNFYTVPARPNN